MNFTAQLDGVQSHVTAFRITDTTQPSATDVDRWVEQYDGLVSLRLGPLDVFSRATATTDELDSIVAAASKIIELGAAADAIDAAYPERAARINTDLGNVFRQRYAAELDALVKMVEKRRAEILAGDTTGDGAAASPAWSFPRSSFQRDRAW